MTLAFVDQAPFAIFTVAGLAITGIIFGVPIAHWVSEKMANFLSFFPTTKFNQTQPLISRGEALSMQGRLLEAAQVYESFLKEHPENLDLYFHIIDLAFGPLNDHAYGNAIITWSDKRLNQRGRRVLRLHRDAILDGSFYPLRHLGWRKDQKNNHPEVAIPEALKGQFAPKI